MSKGLEALERIERDMEYVTRLDFVEPIVRGQVQQELYKIYHREEKDLDIIEKELKALEIIKEKGLYWNIQYQPYEEKNDYRAWDNELYESVKLTKEEYELLKEAFNK